MAFRDLLVLKITPPHTLFLENQSVGLTIAHKLGSLFTKQHLLFLFYFILFFLTHNRQRPRPQKTISMNLLGKCWKATEDSNYLLWNSLSTTRICWFCLHLNAKDISCSASSPGLVLG